MITKLLLTACCAMSMAIGPLAGQAPLQAGDLVRGRLDGKMIQGRLVEVPEPGTPLKLAGKDDRVTVELPWDTPGLARFIRPGRKGQSALIGLAVGAVVGAGIGFASGDDVCGTGGWCLFMWTAEEKAAIGAGSLGLIGGLLGAMAGPGAEWAPITARREASRVGLHLTATGAGIRIAF